MDAAADGEGIYAVTVHYQFDALGLMGMSSLLPVPAALRVAEGLQGREPVGEYAPDRFRRYGSARELYHFASRNATAY